MAGRANPQPLDPARGAGLPGAPARLVTLDDPAYPRRLRELRRPPRAVHLAGAWEGAEPAVAVVGARAASPDGLDVARWLAAGLARAGIAVLSGLARGIDSAAHEGALGAGGRSGAVLGTGIERVYPPESVHLALLLRDSVGLLSELSPEDTGRPGTFASRNRLLAALADVIVVVQGRAGSGALITAREGLALGRAVAAVPWDCRDPLGAAPHELIRSGRATLVRHPEDVLQLLDGRPRSDPPVRGRDPADAQVQGLDPAEALLLAALRRHPQPFDSAAARAGLSASAAAAALVGLELRGLAESGPGGLVRRARPGT